MRLRCEVKEAEPRWRKRTRALESWRRPTVKLYCNDSSFVCRRTSGHKAGAKHAAALELKENCAAGTRGPVLSGLELTLGDHRGEEVQVLWLGSFRLVRAS